MDYTKPPKENNFLSNYMSSLKETDPHLLDFFVSEAKKRKLLSSRAEQKTIDYDANSPSKKTRT